MLIEAGAGVEGLGEDDIDNEGLPAADGEGD